MASDPPDFIGYGDGTDLKPIALLKSANSLKGKLSALPALPIPRTNNFGTVAQQQLRSNRLRVPSRNHALALPPLRPLGLVRCKIGT